MKQGWLLILVYGLCTTITSEKRRSFLPAFDFTTKEEHLVNEIAVSGLKIFENIFGFKSKSFIAPLYLGKIVGENNSCL